ncbi:alpha/beta fold hydrolase [Exiguobacterium flavidum]|uniref:alpha/beta fold hydrolase n=1 Tax=Exiguobacterium flavidum TaxID=2184695 RepID=UPI000DF7D50F|nr:alpha/beta hydrolase [Exiguobacterium flavidum]
MKRYFVECDGVKTRVNEWGDCNRPVIFCLHGLGSTGLSFIEVADALKEEFRIVSIDAPGHGKTQAFQDKEQYHFPSLCNWLNELLKILEIDEFFFLSHSWGSFVALYYLIHSSEKVRGSMLIDGGYQSKVLRGESRAEEILYYEKDFEDDWESWEDFLTSAVYGEVKRRTPLLDLAAKDLARMKEGKYYWHARGHTAGAIISSMYEYELLDFYDEIPVTSLLLLRATLPSTDEDFKEHASSIFRDKTNGTVKAISSTSHMLHWDDPHAVVEEIRMNWS